MQSGTYLCVISVIDEPPTFAQLMRGFAYNDNYRPDWALVQGFCPLLIVCRAGTGDLDPDHVFDT